MSEPKKILLILSPVWSVHMPPLGLAYLCSYLKSKSIYVDILDLNLFCYKNASPELKLYWQMKNSAILVDDRSFESLKPDLEPLFDLCLQKILQFNSDILGFSVYSPNRLFTKKIIASIRKRELNKLIIAGGRGTESKDERDVFEDLVDIFVKGEGEETLAEIIGNYYGRKSFENIPGVARIKDEEIEHFIPRVPIIPLDKIPFPGYEEFDLEKYENKSLPLLMSKGCISECAFCDDCNVMGKFRNKKAESVLQEIKHHVENYEIRDFFFNDPAINCNVAELKNLCDLIIDSHININWIALAIPFPKMSYDVLAKMRKAGCTTLNYGLESGSDVILKKMKKIFTVFEAEQVIRNTRRAGIDAQLNFIVGFPGEQEEEFNETIEFIRRNRDYISGVTNINTCNALLESEIFKESDKYNISFPEDLRIRDTQWFIGNSNTPQVRKQRVEKIINLLSKLNIPIVISNAWEQEQKDRVDKVLTSRIKTNCNSVILVNPPPWGFQNPPIGIGYLWEYLNHRNIKAEVIDLNIDFYNNISEEYKLLWHIENKSFWSNPYTFPIIMEILHPYFDEAINKILSCPSDIIGFSVVDPKERFTIELIKEIKQKAPEKKVILGGPATSTSQQRKIFLDNIPEYIDAFVIGEGEQPLYSLVKNINRGSRIDNIQGILSKHNGKWIYNSVRNNLSLKKIPFPTYRKFNLGMYQEDWLWVEWSRGCWGKCSFCKNYKLIGHYRKKQPEYVIDELKYHVSQNKINNFFVSDNLLNGSLKQLEEICDLIIKDDLKVKWAGSMVPRKEMDYNFFNKMRQAGCYKLQIGLESGSDRVLKKMGKFFTPEISKENIKDAKRAGIQTEIFIMIGFPGEQKGDFEETRDFIKRNASYIDTIKSINTLHLIAGTEVYNNYEKYNMKPLPQSNWHYLWETWDGNNYHIRKKRGEILLNDAWELGLNVTETNLEEGKESLIEQFLKEAPSSNINEAKERLKEKINNLQDLKKVKERQFFLKPHKKIRFNLKLNSGLRFSLVIFLLFLGLILDFYIWILKRIRKCIIFPGT